MDTVINKQTTPMRGDGLPTVDAAIGLSWRSFASIAAILTGILLLMLGNGLQTTLIAVRGHGEGFSDRAMGLIMTAHSVGFILGSLGGPPLIARVGHVRAFAALASLTSMTSLASLTSMTSLAPLLMLDSLAWFVLRVLHGACFASALMITESWLNGSATNATRGRVLAIYGVVVMAASAASQWLLTLSDPSGVYPLLRGVAADVRGPGCRSH